MARYSKTPLSKKLGIKENFLIQVYNLPKNYLAFFLDFPNGVIISDDNQPKETLDFIHIFGTTEDEVTKAFKKSKPTLKKNGILWISWPKKSSKLSSEIDKEFVRNYGLSNDLVDVKVSAIDDDWSAHKFVYRIEDR
ncbi:DUF3052 domain-containing protein [Polaribacter porphyrae]|uniref:DUF3052 domain-containing protein n=1 Tax=Polaribacter porphyrae TaxID=1137780 RepID=A0A2S7WQY2_9FLAO|nr:DUF3052 domain-containing protein [Polaribacter porphyrae]PQJ80030.1 hypothetical protein BTO18_12985 [Polaribacter porphyrae]